LSPPAVHQFSAHLASEDAIGSELLLMQRLLIDSGYDSRIFVADFDREVAGLCLRYNEYEKFAREDDILVVHHSIGSDAIDYVNGLTARKLLVYHNITPEKYFVDWNPNLRRVCNQGRKQLGVLAKTVDAAVGDSQFNADEVEAAGGADVGVLPILYDFSRLGERTAEDDTRSGGDWLHVGRVAPSKAVHDVIRAFALYKKYFRADARLYLAGLAQHGEKYADACRRLVGQLDLEGVIFTGRIAQRKLNELYRKASVLVYASEHEGFGVPFIEAMYCRLPIVAYASSAVAETVGSAGVIYGEKDPLAVAALVDKVVRDSELRKQIAAGAEKELKRFERETVGAEYLKVVARLAYDVAQKGADR
jgi:glycosyltransferase involved in cell wall biosynthesis